MLALIARIEAERIYFSQIAFPSQLKEKVQRVSLLKSSLFSARIEGNPLEISNLASGEEGKKREVFNLLEAVRFIDAHFKKGSLKKETLLELHKRVLKNISPDAGYFRKDISAIFNEAGVAVYFPPPPSEIPKLIDRLLAYINKGQESFPLVTAFVSHLVFEKIHPFLDGNGRVGRLLVAAVLVSKGWSFTFTVPFEEYLDEHKDEYYFHLDCGMKDTNDYLLFMLTAFLRQIQKIKEQIENEFAKKEETFLPPRQDEIYNIIKDHLVCSFDVIRRRFLQVPSRTLRYDLKKLLDRGLIEKTGETRGRYYRVKMEERE
ncbi:MAG: Fic family protein [bacterium]|nr:Fic family protein [bacterium]